MEIEKELEQIKEKQRYEVKDIDLWRRESGFKPNFSTHETWKLTRASGVQCDWGRCTWFSQATPKFAFLTWLAMRDRLATMDRVSSWSQGVDTTCILCKSASESRKHLFFECSYASQIWEHLMRGILRSAYSVKWDDLIRLLTDSGMDKKKRFCFRYTFQVTLYSLWRERNKRRHGEQAMPARVLSKLTDKAVRNKLSLIQLKGVKGLENILQYWFATRV
ncbi:uncharacterized protein LOC103851254 [Brassica rapa]|uniref:uncharacterized protein LOC103851254 n=1 Tax=Brassica campestris TaxID=3711 RepID=UPI00142D3886|nr:uncharacterized protein LOC103851254 [Brassica rapa]XP_048617105.1 uncharacterized protein LOC125589022 [Brassica napus]